MSLGPAITYFLHCAETQSGVMQGAGSVVWSFQMSDSQRSSAPDWVRPFGLSLLSGHTALPALAMELPWPATGALPGRLADSTQRRK